MKIVYWIYNFLWGDLVKIPLPGGNSVALSLLVLILVPAGIFFMIRTRFLPIRLFPDMIKITVSTEKKSDGLSGLQALIVSTATRVGMGNLVGVVAAVSAGGAGAAAQGAEPDPASFENSPRLTPFMITAPKPPAAT